MKVCKTKTYFPSEPKTDTTAQLEKKFLQPMRSECTAPLNVHMYSGLYLKRRLHSNFNTYVVGMERETKDLHLELSLRIRSRARHTVKSPKKEQDNGLQAN